jgi:hypothetical protein
MVFDTIEVASPGVRIMGAWKRLGLGLVALLSVFFVLGGLVRLELAIALYAECAEIGCPPQRMTLLARALAKVVVWSGFAYVAGKRALGGPGGGATSREIADALKHYKG